MKEDYQHYYEVLGLSPGADAADIKRSYFRLVRTYPPEKDPEKFQEIRQAYEMLKDGPPVSEEKPLFPVPEDPTVLYVLEHAHRQLERNNHKAAADCVCEALKIMPDDPFLLCMLAKLQFRAGNPRKAAGTAKKLQQIAPDFNEAYAIAAEGCYQSGWYKKSYPEFQKAYALGYRSMDFLLDYADAADANSDHKTAADLRGGLLKETKWDKSNIDSALYLYSGQIEHCSGQQEMIVLLEDYEQFLHENRRLLKDYGLELASPFLYAVSERPQLLRQHTLYKKADALLTKLMSRADSQDKELALGMRSQLLVTALESNPAFSNDWTMLAAAVMPPDDRDSRMQRYAVLDLLLCLMKEREQNLKMIPTIQRDYPYFYEYVRPYCEILSSDNVDERYEKLKREHARLSERFDGSLFYKRYPEEKAQPRGTVAYSGETPFVRETKKPGRNDPCPCGSGRKFKKCCQGKGIYD